MNYELTNDQITLQQAYREFCNSQILPGAEKLDTGLREDAADLLKSNIKALGKFGFLGLGHNPDYGGKETDIITRTIAGEEIARACAATYISAVTSSVYFGYILNTFGTEEQKKKYLPGIISGEKIGCIALTEYESAENGFAMNTTARYKDGSWAINGVKPYVTNAPVADYYLVAAANEPESEYSGGITFFLIERGHGGCVEGEHVDTMGLHGAQASGVILHNCVVQNHSVVGVPSKGIDILSFIKNFRALFTAVCSLGIASAAMNSSNKYSKERKASGRYINRYQEISFKLADMMIETDISRLMIYKAAWELDNRSGEAASAVSCAKIFTTEAAARITGWAVQIFGGRGYLRGTDAERFYRDVKFGEIAGGTSELQRMSIAAEILDRYCN